MTTNLLLHHNAAQVAAAGAARLITKLVDLQSSGLVPSIALTGGGVGTELLRQVELSPARDAVDWQAVEFFWGDERFLPGGHVDRNETGARSALLDHVPVNPALVHPIAASDGDYGPDPDAAAAAYAGLLADRPPLDVVLLGMGGEGHVASVFPESEALGAHTAVVAVRDCPKPPPTRVSLTLPTIRTASEVWLLVAGAEKAAAVGRVFEGASEHQVPAAGARGRTGTLWLLDAAAAALLPPGPDSLPV